MLRTRNATRRLLHQKSKLCFLNYYIGFPHGLGGLVVELLSFYIFGFSTLSS